MQRTYEIVFKFQTVDDSLLFPIDYTEQAVKCSLKSSYPQVNNYKNFKISAVTVYSSSIMQEQEDDDDGQFQFLI